MPDPIPPPVLPSETPPFRACEQAQNRETERLIAAIERLTRAMDALRQTFVIEEPPPSESERAQREQAERAGIEFAEREAPVATAAVVKAMRAVWPRASSHSAGAALKRAGFRQVRLPGDGRPRAWVRR